MRRGRRTVGAGPAGFSEGLVREGRGGGGAGGRGGGVAGVGEADWLDKGVLSALVGVVGERMEKGLWQVGNEVECKERGG